MDSVTSELTKAYFDSIKELREGELVKGKIIDILKKEVIVDVGYKSEGIVPKDEFANSDDLEKGKEIEVYVSEVEDEEGKIVLSYQRARRLKGWEHLSQNYKEGDLVEGIVKRKVKGGYMVEVFGIEGFLPGSLSTFKSLPDSEYLNQKFYFQIIKINKAKQNFILSRRDALRVERSLQRKKLWGELEAGQIRKGKVKSITNFGAFIDLGGLDGLLHIADMSWKKISHPSEIVAVGDEINVVVLGFDKEKEKISLGLKQTMPDPWQDIETKYPVGKVVQGKIVNIQNYGIFVELEKGIEGLIHISEVSWFRRPQNLAEEFAIGDIIESKIIDVDQKGRKISLSIKRLEKDPWEEVDKFITIDSVVKGKVTGFGDNCAYVELGNGFEGIIYSSDISWTKRINRPQEVLKRMHTYDFKVLGISEENRKVILGMKQIKENPWPKIIETYPIGKVVEGEVVKITNFGIFVKLEDELEGLVFADEIDKEALESLKPSDQLKVKIIKVDPETAKIGLSAKIES